MKEAITISSKQAAESTADELLKLLDICEDGIAAVQEERYQGLSSEEAQSRLGLYGYNELAEKKESWLGKIAGCFWGPMPWMIEAAAVLSLFCGDTVDFLIILCLLLFNATIDLWNEFKAVNALDALKNQLALQSRALRDGSWQEVDARKLVPGDLVRLRLGDIVPADAKLLTGDYLSVDQAALTGESLPVSKRANDTVYSGSIIKQGEMTGLVTATGSNTFLGRTASLVAGAETSSEFQKTIMHIGNFLVVSAVAVGFIMAFELMLSGQPFMNTLQFVLLLIVASIPVAMPAVLSVTMALGTLVMSKEKAIVSRLEAIEELAGVDVLCSDKTGTLTTNKLTLGEPRLFQAKDEAELLLAAARASEAEDGDAIDGAVLKSLEEKGDAKALTEGRCREFVPFDPIAKRTEATVDLADGTSAKYAKGAPQVIIDMCDCDPATRDEATKAVDTCAGKGYRTLGVAASTDDGEMEVSRNSLPLRSAPRSDSAETIREARMYGLDVKMVTGDHVAIGVETSGKLGLGTHMLAADQVFDENFDPNRPSDRVVNQVIDADGFAQVFPEHKYAIVKAFQEKGHVVAMTGDGVNDAPALKQADVGIAVEGATDAARAASDLVLTAPGISTIVTAIQTSRRVFGRLVGYTLYRNAMTIDVMLFVALATMIYNFKPLSVVMIVLLALLDDVPVMAIAYDNTEVAKKPCRFHIKYIIGLSSVLGVLSVMETFGLLVVALDTDFQGLIANVTGTMIKTEHIQSLMFLQLIAGGHLLLFVTRTNGRLWQQPWPSFPLLAAILGTQLLAVILCGFGLLVTQLPWLLIGGVYLYNIIWMFFLDLVKNTMNQWADNTARYGAHQRMVGRLSEPLFASHHAK